MTVLSRSLLAAALAAAPAAAQAAEVVFVGTSVGGTTDPHWFVDSATGTIVQQAGIISTDNVTDAVWMNQGADLYCSKSLGNDVTRAQWNGTSATWSTFFPAPGSCYGLGADHGRQRLWVLTGPSGSTRELVCLDADPASAGYGTVLAQTSVLGTTNRERWELSASGNLAAVPQAFLGSLDVVDTNPASPTFLQITASVPIPGAGGGFTIASACAFSPDDLFCYLLYTGLGVQGIAVLFVPLGQLIDFDPAAPGQQDFVLPLPVPNRMDIAPDGRFVVVSGQGGAGWAARVDIDPFQPQNATLTQYLAAGVLSDCNGISLSADGTRVAVTATPAQLVLFDAGTGALLQSVVLPGGSNLYTTAWQDLRPRASFTAYGAGCAGTLGVPLLAPAAGSLPVLGSVFVLELANVPLVSGARAAILAAGFSSTSIGSLPLPLDLTPFGMPGCSLLADPLVTVLGIVPPATPGNPSWQIAVPAPGSFAGLELFVQGFALDPPANAAGLTTSNGGRARVGL